ncbi:MAG: hypothetical protein ACRC5Q_00465 [Culicoidibacterales bacterium]
MELIERYLQAVLMQIPKVAQKEVEQCLRAEIAQRLAEIADQSDDQAKICFVLEQLGDPQMVALEYGAPTRMLIGPTYFPTYWKVLKIVGLAIFGGVTLLTILQVLTREQTLWQIVSFYLNTLWQILLHGAVWVTVIFAVFEYKKIDLQADSPFRVESLPELPIKKIKISRGEAIFSLIVTVLFFLFLNSNPKISYLSEDLSANLRVFVPDVFAQTSWLFFLSVSFSLGQDWCKTVWGQWTWLRAGINALLAIGSTGFAVLFLTNMALYPVEVMTIFEKLTNFQAESGILALVLFVIMITCVEIASPFYKLFIYSKTPKNT